MLILPENGQSRAIIVKSVSPIITASMEDMMICGTKFSVPKKHVNAIVKKPPTIKMK